MPRKKGTPKKTPPNKGSTSGRSTQPMGTGDALKGIGGKESPKRKSGVGNEGETNVRTCAPKMRKLDCSHPYSIGKPVFDIKQEGNMDKKFYEIHSLSPMNIDDDYTVEKYTEDNHFLNYIPYDCLLDDWLNGQKDIWCPTYQGWGEYRPNEGLRKIIKGMVLAVGKLHERGEFHGSLGSLENYALRFVKSYNGEVENERVEVILLYKSYETKTKLTSSKFNDGNIIIEGMKDDMISLSKVIFGSILEIENLKSQNLQIARDWNNLYSWMRNESFMQNKQKMGHLQFIVASHPCLWHWKAKLQFFGKVWNEYIQGCGGQHGNTKPVIAVGAHAKVQNQVRVAMQKVGCAFDWKTRIAANSPFDKMFKDPIANGYFDNTDFLRFARAINFHINDKDKQGKQIYFDETTEGCYSNMQYVEKIIDDTFPMFLVNLHYHLGVKGMNV